MGKERAHAGEPLAPAESGALVADRNPVLIALMLAMGLVALDSTIVATAVPNIVRDLGGFSQFPWLFSVYLLTQAVTVPLYGRFADSVGRKPVLLFGIAVFVAGSVLCGTAWSMPVLIFFRALQGIGAGAVQPITTTIVGDLYTVQERGKIQGYLSSVWGIASVLGPALGGVFAQYLSWRGIFFINVPVAAVTVWMLGRHYSERVTGVRHRIDFSGAVTLITGCTLGILALLEGGVAWAWASAPSIGLFVAAAVLLAAFVLIERRSSEPMLPLWVFGRRTLLAGNLGALSVGAVTMGLSSYVPTYVQGVKGTGAVIAGFTLAAMSLGWPLASSVSGRVYGKLGFRDTGLIGCVFMTGGMVLFSALQAGSPLIEVATASFIVGVGLGFGATAIVVAVQSVVGWNRRGVVTGANMFTRSIGSAVGVAVLGAIANSVLANRFAHPPAAIAGRLPHSVNSAALVLGQGPRLQGSAEGAFVRASLNLATHDIFEALTVAAALTAVFLVVMPRRTRQLQFAEDAPAGG